jgi:HK97 family phage major capsid protein
MLITDAIKANEDYTLDVLGLPFGVDRQGQSFDASTDIGLSAGDSVPAYYYHGFAERAAKSVARIGRAVYDHVDAAGHWFKVQLDTGSDIARRIYDDAAKGLARASSDSATHLVRPAGIVGKPGRVSSWPIFAMSLMDAATADAAVNPRARVFAAAKAFIEDAENEIATEAETVEATGDATKAGAVFAKRNKERIEAMRRVLDEMLSEIPQDEDVPATVDNIVPVKSGEIEMETEVKIEATPVAEAAPVAPAIDVAALKAELRAELNAEVAKFNRPSFNVNTGAAKAQDDAAKSEDRINEAFLEYMQTGSRNAYQVAVKATLNQTTAAEGGVFVPKKYANEIVAPLTIGSVLRQAGARVIRVDGTNSFNVPSMTNATRAVVKAEKAAYVANEPTSGTIEFTPWKFTHLGKITEELDANSMFDVYSQVLAPDAANAFILAENADFIGGNGSATAQGITVGASVGVTAAGTNAFTADEVIDLYHSLSSQYRPQAVWLMSDSTLKVIRKYRESGSTTGAFLWQPALSVGEPSTLMGRPVYTVPDMPAATTGLKPIVFGDPRFYWIADFNGGQPSVQRLNELYAGTGEIGFRWWKYVDANVVLSAAIKSLIMA